jgi:hypothetical protein
MLETIIFIILAAYVIGVLLRKFANGDKPTWKQALRWPLDLKKNLT